MARLHVFIWAAVEDDVYRIQVEIGGASPVERFQAVLARAIKNGRGGHQTNQKRT